MSKKNKCVACGKVAHRNGSCIDCDEFFCRNCFFMHTGVDFEFRKILGNEEDIDQLADKITDIVRDKKHPYGDLFDELFKDKEGEQLRLVSFLVLATLPNFSPLIYANTLTVAFRLGFLYKDQKDKFESMINDIELDIDDNEEDINE